MKIASTSTERPIRPTRPLFGQVQPPVGLTDLGLAEAVIQAPTTEDAWIALTDRLPRGGAHAATRLFVTLDRVNAASRVVAKALQHIGDRQRENPPVPGSWVDKLAELVVEEYDALIAWDDAAHNAAHVPEWVEVPPGERPVPSTEQSWVRVSRLVARAVQVVPGDGWSDAVFDALALIDPYREGPGLGEVERIKTACRDAVRLAITATYSQETSMTQQDGEEPIKQNVPTTLACPKCGGDVLIMTRKADRRRFLACRNFYDERVRCDYTENSLPQYLLMKEAGATPLPGLDL